MLIQMINKSEKLRNLILRRILQMTDQAFAPKKLSIEITERCNLNCPMCPRNFTQVTNASMPVNKFIHILDQIPSLRYVTLLGRGETLMADNFFNFLKAGLKRNIEFTVVTNGTLFNDNNIAKLESVSNIVVSIDSPFPDKYKKLRGFDLNLIERSLINLKARRPTINLTVQSLILQENISDLTEFIYFAKRIHADQITFIHPIGFDESLGSKHSGNFESELSMNMRNAQQLASQEKIKLIATPSLCKPRICSEPWTSLRIALNGDIYPCCYIYETAEAAWTEFYLGTCVQVTQTDYIMGNIFNASFKEIWNGTHYKKLRRIVRQTQPLSLMPSETLNQHRKSMSVTKDFEYCSICLFRQNRAC